MLSYRLAKTLDGNAVAKTGRALGDECLVSCAFFSARLRRKGGSIRHYVSVGQTAYDAAGLIEAALGFPHMLDVLVAVRSADTESQTHLMDLARAGSGRARQILASQNVVLFKMR
jgi:hypothetical protein